MAGFVGKFLLVVAILAASAAFVTPRHINGVRKMHFYMHDLFSISTTLAATPNRNKPGQFGSIVVIDDPLTDAPAEKSKVVGRARGTYMTVDSLNKQGALFLTFTAVFKKGTISFHGEDDVFQPVREIAVVGGTGDYRFISGYGRISTVSVFNNGTAHLSVEVFYKF